MDGIAYGRIKHDRHALLNWRIVKMQGMLAAVFIKGFSDIMQNLTSRLMATSTAALLVALSFSTAYAQQTLPVNRFSVGINVIEAEVASTEPQRELGLMNRKQLGTNQGMMFIFDRPSGYCMWMKNTLLPLSVAFLDKEGVIVNIEEMLPQTETTHCATRAALYALEMSAGWFKTKGIKAGAKIELLK